MLRTLKEKYENKKVKNVDRIDKLKIMRLIPLKYRDKIKDPLKIICKFLDATPWDDKWFLNVESVITYEREVENISYHTIQKFSKLVYDFSNLIPFFNDYLLISDYTRKSYFEVLIKHLDLLSSLINLYYKRFSRNMICPCNGTTYVNYSTHIRSKCHKRDIQEKKINVLDVIKVPNEMFQLWEMTRNFECYEDKNLLMVALIKMKNLIEGSTDKSEESLISFMRNRLRV